MAVLRDYTSENNDFIVIGTICSVVFMVVAILGIKLKWFKHRLTFNEFPRSDTTRGHGSDSVEPQIIKATFRPSSEFDNFVEIIPPKILPPVRISAKARNTQIPLPPLKRRAPEAPSSKSEDAINEFLIQKTETSHNIGTQNISAELKQSENDISENLNEPHNAESQIILRPSTPSPPPPPLPLSPIPTNDEQEENKFLLPRPFQKSERPIQMPPPPPYQLKDPLKNTQHFERSSTKKADLIIPVHQIKSKKNSFLYQVPSPTEMPTLKAPVSASLPSLLVVENEKPIAKLMQSSSDINQKLPEPSSSKSGFFGFLSSKKLDKEIEKKHLEKEKTVKEKEKKPSEKEKKPSEKEKKPTEKEKKPTEKPTEKPTDKEKKLMDKPQKMIEQPIKKKSVRVLKQPKTKVDLAVDKTKPNLDRGVRNTRVMSMEVDKKSEVENNTNVEKLQPKKSKSKDKRKRDNPRKLTTASIINPDLNVSPKNTESPNIGAAYNDKIELKPIHMVNNDQKQPQAKQRTVLNLQGFDSDDDGNSKTFTDIHSLPKKPLQSSIPIHSPSLSPPSPSDNENDTWNLVAKHRQNTQTLAMVQPVIQRPATMRPISVEDLQTSKVLQRKQIDIINRPKTMREMKREQMENNMMIDDRKGKDIRLNADKKGESDTEA